MKKNSTVRKFDIISTPLLEKARRGVLIRVRALIKAWVLI